MAKTKVAGAALNQTPIDWANNLNNIKNAIELARSEGVKILCLPELCLTGYGCEDLFLSEWLPAKALSLIPKIIPWTKDIAVTIGIPVAISGKTYNCIVVIKNKEILGVSAKQFLANDGVHYEPRWFTAWEAKKVTSIEVDNQSVPFGDLTYDLFGVQTGFEICEDAWRPERPAKKLAEKNISLILNPSASHFAFGKSLSREQLVVDSSRNFKCYYIYANLLGNEAGRMIYDGEIVIAGHGSLLQFNNRLSFRDVNLTTAIIDPEEKSPKAVMKNIPPENKNDIFTQAEALALFDYLRKSHSKGFVLSLSGGADSTTCAILVSEMVKRSIQEIGLEACLRKLHIDDLQEACEQLEINEQFKFVVGKILHCCYQGTVNSSKATLSSAQELVNEIGAQFDHWLIDEEVNSYSTKIERVIGRKLSWESDDLAMQNIQSRTRSPIIWMLANIKNALLLVTSNRSEGDVGYATMDGDTSGSIAPIAAVDKYFILNWLKWAENALSYQSLSYVNNLDPSAELRPLENSQTDEDDLMPYDTIQKIEEMAIRDRKSPLDVFHALVKQNPGAKDSIKQHVRKFFTLWCRNQWKRERTAPAFHLDDFNVDPRTWCRFPILSSGYFDELAEIDDL